MKLASFERLDLPEEHGPCYGLVTTEGVHAAPPPFRERYPSLRDVLAADAAVALADACRDLPALEAGTYRFSAVIPTPAKILCVGINYLKHIEEMGREKPDYPTLFVRFADSLTGHERSIVRPKVSREYDYEGELAFVIGRTARHVAPADAMAYIAGYTAFLDGSIRDFQRHTSQFIPGKNFPDSGACGPWLVTTDEVADPGDLLLRTRVNGELLQSAPVRDLCITVPQILAYCSRFCRLEPGDIIATGTPSGVGFARKPPRWLQPGDVVEVEISEIGVLRNTVVAEEDLQ